MDERPIGHGESGPGEAILLLGGRQMGKTSLRERIQYEVRDQGRAWITLGFEAMPDHLQSVELERWFMLKLAEAYGGTDHPFVISWPDAVKDSYAIADKIRERLRAHLDHIKTKTGRTALWTFDETDWLARADCQGDRQAWRLFHFFRSLVAEGRLCLIATGYPHGAGRPESLHIAHGSCVSPMHNTFTQVIRLIPFTPVETWDFLHSRMAGLGAVLPHRWRNELLVLTRGIPWAVQELGFALCDALQRREGRKLVDAAVWREARGLMLRILEDRLKRPVEDAARKQDRLHLSRRGHRPEANLERKLWLALCDLARCQALAMAIVARWPDEPSITLGQLRDLLPDAAPDALGAALDELHASPTLRGDESDAEIFYFSHGLLPVWLYYGEIQRGQS